MNLPASNISSRWILPAGGLALVALLAAAAGVPASPRSPRSAAVVAGQTGKADTAPTPSSESSRAVFERRIRPLLTAKNPSTCAECHLSGVDLKDYIRPSEAETFAALRDQGMLDLKRPEESRILRLIRMSRPQTPLVTQQARTTEYEAFRAWIVAASADPKPATVKSVTKSSGSRVGPAVPDAVIRHTRLDSVVASFERNVWSQEGRCMGCHRPDNKKNVEQYGPRVRWFVPGDPEATMRNLIAQGDVNVEKPAESRLLLKPMNKVPHGGGVKMLYGDAGYKLFRAWLEDYAKSVKGAYRTANDLPVPPSGSLVFMDTILALKDGPAGWADKLTRVDVYPWDAAKNAWAATPVATGERGMFAPKPGAPTGTNLIMFLVVPGKTPSPGRTAAEDRAAEAERLRARLGAGRYLLRYYCDTAGRLNADYTLPTDSPTFYQGQQEVAVEKWFGGWGSPVAVTVSPTK